MKKLYILIVLIIMFLPISVLSLDNKTINVTVGNVEEDDVIDIDITWGNLSFTYVVENNYKWDSTTHKYIKEETKSYWTNNGNSIAIKNKSKKVVNIDLQYEPAISSVSGAFSLNNFKIDANKQKTVSFVVSGNLSSNYSKATSAGIITVGIK